MRKKCFTVGFTPHHDMKGNVMETQILTVTSILCQRKEKPKLLFTGPILAALGFNAKSLVVAKSAGDTITLESRGTGIEAYKQAVSEVREKGHTTVEVINLDKSLSIILSGDWLLNSGFKTGDVVIARFETGVITVKRLDLLELGFSINDVIKTKVHKIQIAVNKKKRVPRVLFSGHWLDDIGFQAGQYAKITYQNEMITFETGREAGDISDLYNKNHGRPPKVKIHKTPCYNGYAPCFQLKGEWLSAEGFQIGDTLVVLYEHERIRVKRLDISKYGF